VVEVGLTEGEGVSSVAEGLAVTFKKLGRALRWGLVTGGMMALGWFGHEYPKRWAWNIYLYLFWLTAVISVFVAVSKDVQKKIRERGRSVPMSLDLLTDIAQIIVLASWGHFWMAGVWTLHTGIYNSVFTIEEEKKCEESSPSQP
jgi:hypothetical protein